MKTFRIIFGIALLTIGISAFAFTVPPNDGFVTDTVGVLTPQQRASLNENLQEYQRQTSNEIAILLTRTMSGESIADVGVQVGRAWGVGTKEHDNGILILAALEDREVTIQTGYGLEGAVPDIVAKGIIDQDIIPAFRNGNYHDGLLSAVEDLKKHMSGEYTPDRYAQSDDASGSFVFFVVLFFIILNFLSSYLARSKSWWLGGLVGGGMGIFLTYSYSWWLAIPSFVVMGLFFDYAVSRLPRGTGRRGGRGGWWWGGGGGFGGGGGGGSSFGGGSFGGGGASGRW